MENSQRDGNTRTPDLALENQYAGQEATVRTKYELFLILVLLIDMMVIKVLKQPL